ncbi:hypothetical protein NSB25_13100 [Acetatifactor muris]|uniref:Uncharacterized protein n=1 Tax=Acetatifactor muris TaxID=879566 RepID=A0A2K4ZHZ0_9FIRM|nr:hypothetical protein [Acetatifactor muris]MCI8801519.1 hypothetical protein [Lachnospiraceae bacterium]MCR2048224.1 hypothetical protein [Acetatifactor muris]SOY30012.1 hypothetical protein AMURIS_02733 [Acetatifactor muris]
MHTKTMEGLAGASMSMKLMNTPMRVYKEAERRGDTAVMERAMGYASDFADEAEDYRKTTKKGMKEDAKEAREKAKTEQENAIQKRREQREELEKRIAESRNEDTDTVSISESGKAALDGKSDLAQAGTNGSISTEETADDIKKEPVIYTISGEAAGSEPGASFSASV